MMIEEVLERKKEIDNGRDNGRDNDRKNEKSNRLIVTSMLLDSYKLRQYSSSYL